MAKPYNTGPCIPDDLKEKLALLPDDIRLGIEQGLKLIDDTYSAAAAVRELADFLPGVRLMMSVTPIISPGIYDLDTTELFLRAMEEWTFAPLGVSGVSHVLVAGHHPEPGNDMRLGKDYLQEVLDGYVLGAKVVSQVQAANAPAQAVWIAGQVEQLGLKAIALRTHPSHSARAFQTLLKELEKRGLHREVVMLPWWRSRNPYQQFALTEPWEDQSYSDVQLYPGEMLRNCNYGRKGDVATPEEVHAYINWLFTESPAAEAFQLINR